MSETPRTDTLLVVHDLDPKPSTLIEHARQLERELAAANQRVQELEEAGDSLQKRLRIWSNLCGKRFVVGDEEAIANWIAVKKKGTKP